MLPETDRDILHLVRRVIGLIIGATVLATAAAFGLFYVQRDAPTKVFLATVMGWSAYLFSHYAVTGQLVHQPSEQHVIPDSGGRLAAALFGFIFLTAGMALGFTAVGRTDLFTASIGFFAAFAGYIISHYGVTGTLL